MVSKADKRRMSLFVLDRLEDASLYKIDEKDNSHILVVEKDFVTENPRKIYVALHSSKMPIRDLIRLHKENRIKEIHTAHVFYKDGKTFMVRLGSRGHFKGNYRSLKEYSNKEINAMIHLRGLEKEILGEYPELTYYQPLTQNLPECLRIFEMGDVELDYSHIEQWDDSYSFARAGTSIDYKTPKERVRITSEPIYLKPDDTHLKRAWLETSVDIKD